MKTFFVAEIGANWEGELSKAKKIITECKKAGVDAVKFQMWRAHDLYLTTHPNWKRIKKSELNFNTAEKIKKFSDDLGIEFFCSVFYPEAAVFLDSLKVKRFKIASRTCLLKDPYSLETLEAIAKTEKPVIVSMGMGGNKNLIKKILTNNQLVFCYCISEYPTPFYKINWKSATEFIGFSDHTLGIVAPLIFSVLQKQKNEKYIIIEKHIKTDTSKGPDASTSLTTRQLAELMSYIRIIEKKDFC